MVTFRCVYYNSVHHGLLALRNARVWHVGVLGRVERALVRHVVTAQHQRLLRAAGQTPPRFAQATQAVQAAAAAGPAATPPAAPVVQAGPAVVPLPLLPSPCDPARRQAARDPATTPDGVRAYGPSPWPLMGWLFGSPLRF